MSTWWRGLAFREIADEIEESLDFLSTTLRDVPERHRSLRAVFDHSWQLLPQAEKTALARLSVFRGSFEREAAQQVAGADLPLLASLVDKSLLWRGRSGRCGMHEAVRQYAADRLEEIPGEGAKVREQHCQYYAGFLAQREDDLRGQRLREALNEIAQEIENIRAAWRWAVAHTWVPALRRTAISLATFLQVRSLFQEGEEAFGQAATALEAARGQGTTEALDRALGLLWACQAQFAFRLYREEQARGLLPRGLTLLRPLGLEEALAMAEEWGVVAGLEDNVVEAEACTSRSLDYFQATVRNAPPGPVHPPSWRNRLSPPPQLLQDATSPAHRQKRSAGHDDHLPVASMLPRARHATDPPLQPHPACTAGLASRCRCRTYWQFAPHPVPEFSEIPLTNHSLPLIIALSNVW